MAESEIRSINELIDLPYSEMTEEEIAYVIDYKAEIKARDEAYQARMDALKAHCEEVKAIHKQIADNAQATLEALTQHAIEQYLKAGEK